MNITYEKCGAEKSAPVSLKFIAFSIKILHNKIEKQSGKYRKR